VVESCFKNLNIKSLLGAIGTGRECPTRRRVRNTRASPRKRRSNTESTATILDSIEGKCTKICETFGLEGVSIELVMQKRETGLRVGILRMLTFAMFLHMWIYFLTFT